jgi:predicted dehydrogenase
MATRLSRRDAMKLGATGTLGYFFTGPAASAARAFGANGKIAFACVGVGGKGDSDSEHVATLGDVLAVCDIDDKFRSAKKGQKAWVGVGKDRKRTGPMYFEKAKEFTDYRKLLEDPVMKDVDAVTVSTPDHHHANVAIPAMRLKKHVYVQKPLTQSAFEARLMREAAKKYGVCTQMGNQGTTENGLRRAVELVQAGTIGDVREVHVWTNRPVWPQAPEVTDKKMPKEAPVPENVHWEEFIGTAPMRPYAMYGRDVPRNRFGVKDKDGNNGAYHDFNWRGWWAFGTGAIGDMACHTANMSFMALKLGLPYHVSAEAGDVNPETCPSFAHVTMQFAARAGMPPCTVHWYEGSKDGKLVHPPEEWVHKAVELYKDSKTADGLVNSGSILVGSKGYIYSPDDYGAKFYLGGGDFAKVNTTKPEKLPVRNEEGQRDHDQNHKAEWVEAIKAGKPEIALSNFEYASRLTESFLLGNCAIRSGKTFAYDAESGQITDPDAARFFRYERRKGWDLIDGKA